MWQCYDSLFYLQFVLSYFDKKIIKKKTKKNNFIGPAPVGLSHLHIFFFNFNKLQLIVIVCNSNCNSSVSSKNNKNYTSQFVNFLVYNGKIKIER